jgi:hypothetical protein
MSKLKKYLISQAPELQNNSAIPVSFNFTQIYTTFLDENEDLLPEMNNTGQVVLAEAFQTRQYFLNGGHYKPISKLIRSNEEFY